MNCPICEAPMQEYQEYYRCTNRNCKIQMNKCLKEMPIQSLYPHKKPFWTPEKVKVLQVICLFAIVGLFLGFLGMSEGVRLGGI